MSRAPRPASELWPARLAMAAAMITVGSTLIASRAMAGMPVFVAAFLRFAVATPALAALAWLGGGRLPKFAPREWLLLALQAALGSVGYTVLLIRGMALTSGSDASVVVATLPAVAAVLAFVVLREPVNRRVLVAIALATAGVALLGAAAPAEVAQSQARWRGDAFVLGAVVCEACFLLLNKLIRTPLAPRVLAALMAAGSLLLSTPPALVQLWQAHGPVLSTSGFRAAVYYALVPTLLGFNLWYFGAAQVRAREAALYTAVLPIAGLTLSALLLGDAIEPRHVLGGALAVGGIVVGAGGARGDT